MAIKTVKVGSLRALHKHLSAVLAEVDGVPAEDIDLVNASRDSDLVDASRGGANTTMDSRPSGSVSINAIPGFDRISKHRA